MTIVTAIQRVLPMLIGRPGWLLPDEEIHVLVSTHEHHDNLEVIVHIRDSQTGEDRYAMDEIHGKLLRILSFTRSNDSMLKHLDFVVEHLVPKLKPKRCRDHDDCLSCIELAEACWASTDTSTKGEP